MDLLLNGTKDFEGLHSATAQIAWAPKQHIGSIINQHAVSWAKEHWKSNGSRNAIAESLLWQLPYKAYILKQNFLIVDDHEIVRAGLKYLLREFYQGVFIDEAKDGKEAVMYLKSGRYSLVILDIRMPRTNVFELVNFIVAAYPRTRILVYSMCQESLYGQKLINAGVHGYLSKDASVAELRTAIDTTLANKRFVSGDLLEVILGKSGKADQENPFSMLSSRELEVTSLLLAGWGLSEIARQTHLQRSTVGTYKSRIFEKLDISNLMELKELASLYNF